MRLPVYLVCAALLLASRTSAEDADTDTNVQTSYYTTGRQHADEADSLGFLVPRYSAKLRAPALWNEIAAPRVYLMGSESEYSNAISPQDYLEQDDRLKRAGPSLSITNNLDVLRKNLLQQINKTKQLEADRQMERNREIFSKIGKRGPFLRQLFTRYGHPISYDNM